MGLSRRLALLTAVIAVALVLGATEVALRWSERSRLDDRRRESVELATSWSEYLSRVAPNGEPETFALARYLPPFTCRVPSVRGVRLAQARRALTRAGCATGRIERVYSARARRGRVIAQLPRAGVRAPELTPVRLLGPKAALFEAADDVLRRAGGRPGHIFNLGHGVLPSSSLETVQELARHVHAFSRQA